MKIVYPSFYKSFKCIADKCEDTCCAGWEIVVDSDSVAKYSKVQGEFGAKLNSLMKVDEDCDTVFISQNKRCPFLNDNNLCDIYIYCGEDHLCRTCMMFPRFTEEFGSLRELGLGFGCPEAVRIILGLSEPWSFVSETNDELPLPNDIDAELYFSLVKLREKIFGILFDSSISVECSLSNILELTDLCQSFIDDEDFASVSDLCGSFQLKRSSKLKLFGAECKKVISEFEILSDEWRQILSKVNFDSSVEFTEHFRNIAANYIYRYFMKSVYDYDSITKIRACVFSCEVIARVFAAGVPLEKAVRMYSKEAEYSADNLEILYDYL